MSHEYVRPVQMYRIEARDGGVMYLERLDKAITELATALHQLAPMPDSMTIELAGIDGTKVLLTKADAVLLHDQMTALNSVGAE